MSTEKLTNHTLNSALDLLLKYPDLRVKDLTLEELFKFNSNDLVKLSRLDLYVQFLQIHERDRALTKPEICKMLNVSVSTFDRLRWDLNLPSPFKRVKEKKDTTSQPR